MLAVTSSKIIEDQDLANSNRCSTIVNKRSGLEFHRSSNPLDQWPLVFVYASKKPEEFELIFDRELASPVNSDGIIMWTKEDLMSKSMPSLREIGVNFSVTSNSKEKLADLILKAQAIKARE